MKKGAAGATEFVKTGASLIAPVLPCSTVRI